MLAATRIVPKAVEAFRTGDGIGWHEHDPDLFQGTERFFRPGYAANLAQSWIPSLDGADAKLRAGGRAADVGCGFGTSTIIMATRTQTRFSGASITTSRRSVAPPRLPPLPESDRVNFQVASAKEYPGRTTT